ncbi:unnamed protein product [Toxocara canis]|uniref:Uncharacterized protein n=1 Tax=Toxocara canis TaxID=6265 RepID=A0A183TXP0_TOXCA|nr:unnamed protein product [Toxocara canis]
MVTDSRDAPLKRNTRCCTLRKKIAINSDKEADDQSTGSDREMLEVDEEENNDFEETVSIMRLGGLIWCYFR